MKLFRKEAPEHAEAWTKMNLSLGNLSPFELKTKALIRISLLAALKITSGIPFHVISAKELGVTREEIINAVLAGLTLIGNVVTHSLPIALEAYDEK
jgi:alkylhydroperoxidase/carboxymuconolactone decarboxylase family protein YurZ